MPKSENALHKKPRQQNRQPESSIIEGFSLLDITPGQAEILLALPLMQGVLAEGAWLPELKEALEKKRDGLALSPIDTDVLELAGEIVYSALPSAGRATGEALYVAEERALHIEEFARAALQFTVARGPLLA